MENMMHKIWDDLKFGETVLVEHDSVTSPALGLYHLVKWAKEKGYSIIVDDVMDTLYLYKVHLKLMGFDTSILDDVKVIKEGGTLNVGHVVERIAIRDVAIRRSNYERIFEPLLSEGQIVNPVLGIEKMFLLAESKREILTTINAILSYTGDERRIAFFFINTALVEKSRPYLMTLLEELATTVIMVAKEGRSFKFSVLKSVNNTIEGMEIKV